MGLCEVCGVRCCRGVVLCVFCFCVVWLFVVFFVLLFSLCFCFRDSVGCVMLVCCAHEMHNNTTCVVVLVSAKTEHN